MDQGRVLLAGRDITSFAGVHPVDPVAGSFRDLAGNAIAVTERPTDGVRFRIGDRATVIVGTASIDVRIAVVLPERLSTDHQILLPRDLVPAEVLAPAPTDVPVQVDDCSDVQRAAAAARAYGEVTAVDTGPTANAEDLRRTNDATLVVLLALAGLYTVMAVVNAVVIAGTGRRREHAIARCPASPAHRSSPRPRRRPPSRRSPARSSGW